MEQAKVSKNGYQSRVWTSTVRLFCWSLAWVLATALMKFGPRLIWNNALAFTVLAIGLDLALGIGLILANKNYLADLDELQQRVHLNAFGITLGVGLVISVPAMVMNYLQLISFHPEIEHLLVLMSLTFVVSVVYGSLRYR